MPSAKSPAASGDSEPHSAVPPIGTQAGEDLRKRRHNFRALVVYQVIVRIGWIFKTESIVMPAFVDFLGASGVIRGCLPMLNRLGQSVPPLLYAHHLTKQRSKKRALTATTLGIAVPFALLSLLWWSGIWRSADGSIHGWMVWVFLAIYAGFMVALGCNQLALQTVQGKLVAANRRGLLFTTATVLGAPLAIAAVMLTMPAWLAREDGGFGSIFAASAIMFVFAAVAAGVLLKESPDLLDNVSQSFRQQLAESWHVLRDDSHCRRLATVAALFGTVLMLFPHYQAMGRERLGLGHGNLLVWVAVQNVATAFCSLLAGPLADRFGNRAALHVACFGSVLAPLWATGLVLLPPTIGGNLFWVVFLPLGFTPVVIRLLMNYALEIAPKAKHARYVSVVGLSLAAPVVIFSVVVGQLVTWLGFELVFLGGAALIFFASLLTFRLVEPRHVGGQVLVEYPE